jgi:hypothetical protein
MTPGSTWGQNLVLGPQVDAAPTNGIIKTTQDDLLRRRPIQ